MTQGSDAASVGPLRLSEDVTFVLMVSKLCNLRCRYCYEYPDLGDPARVSLDQLRRVFSAVARHYRSSRGRSICFAWQGGEPLLIPPAFYHAAMEAQRRAFRDTGLRFTNVLQTNLTRLDPERIEMLRECFDGVGVSHDVVGELRVDAGGKSRSVQTVENLDRLIRSGLRIGGISVLTRENVHSVRRIYEFWRSRGLPFRLLPVHRGPYPDPDRDALEPAEVAEAFRECVDLWFQDDDAVDVLPIVEMLRGMMARYDPRARVNRYDKGRWETVLIVDNFGRVGGINDQLDSSRAYGNVFDSSLAEILGGERHQKAVDAANARIQATCCRCPYFETACSGHPVAEGEIEFPPGTPVGEVRCVTRSTLAHIERRLTEARIIDRVTSELRIHSLPGSRPASSPA